MALTKHLRSKDSPVRAFFTQRLPNTRAPMNRNGAWPPGEALVLPATEAGYPWSTVGGWRLTTAPATCCAPRRWLTWWRPQEPGACAALPGIPLRSQRLGRTWRRRSPRRWLLRRPRRARLHRRRSWHGSACCWPALRSCSGLPCPVRTGRSCAWGRRRPCSRCSPTADDRAVGDLVGLTRLFRERRADLLAATPLVLNPTFAGSGQVGGADADLIASGCLLDIKVSKPRRRARKDTQGRLFNPARLTQPRWSALRISHSPDPPPTTLRRAQPGSKPPVDNRGERYCRPPDKQTGPSELDTFSVRLSAA